MKTPEQVKTEFCQEWVKKARQDLGVAKLLLQEEGNFLSAVGFHCQQASEKYLKAFLTWHQVYFPKTHNIDELLDLAAGVNYRLAESLRSAAILTRYGVETRYPGDMPELSLEQAKEAVKLAENVKKAVSSALKKSKAAKLHLERMC
jgi:HEPN domain-containing protein